MHLNEVRDAYKSHPADLAKGVLVCSLAGANQTVTNRLVSVSVKVSPLRQL